MPRRCKPLLLRCTSARVWFCPFMFGYIFATSIAAYLFTSLALSLNKEACSELASIAEYAVVLPD